MTICQPRPNILPVTTVEQETAIIDASTRGVTYYGWTSDPTSTESDATWKIIRKYEDGVYTYYHLADNTELYDKQWDLRDTYFDPVTPNIYASIYFDGATDRIRFPSGNYAFDYNDAFSVSMWVKFGTLSGHQTIIGNVSGTNIGWQIFKANSTNFLTVRMVEVANTNELSTRGSVALVNNTWYHVVLTKSTSNDVSSIKLYLNGVSETMVATINTLTSGPTYTTQVFELGSRSGGQLTAGLIDNVIIDNREFTQDEVTELYNNGLGITPSAFSDYANISSAWRIGEGDSNVTNGVVDLKNNCHGTMTSMLDTNIVGSYPGEVI